MEGQTAVLKEDAEYVGVSKLRVLDRNALKGLRTTLIIIGPEDDGGLAVILPYEEYLRLLRVFMSNAGHPES